MVSPYVIRIGPRTKRLVRGRLVRGRLVRAHDRVPEQSEHRIPKRSYEGISILRQQALRFMICLDDRETT
jgi:hypothetical protein